MIAKKEKTAKKRKNLGGVLRGVFYFINIVIYVCTITFLLPMFFTSADVLPMFLPMFFSEKNSVTACFADVADVFFQHLRYNTFFFCSEKKCRELGWENFIGNIGRVYSNSKHKLRYNANFFFFASKKLPMFCRCFIGVCRCFIGGEIFSTELVRDDFFAVLLFSIMEKIFSPLIFCIEEPFKQGWFADTIGRKKYRRRER